MIWAARPDTTLDYLNHTFVDRDHPKYEAPWNHISNTARVFTPEDNLIDAYTHKFGYIGSRRRSDARAIDTGQLIEPPFLHGK